MYLFRQDQAPLRCHLSGGFIGLLDVVCTLGELVDFDCGVRSLALHRGACRFICRCICHHLTACIRRHSLSPLVNSYPGALAAARFCNRRMRLTVHRVCTSGTVIVCRRDCSRFLYGYPPIFKFVVPPATNQIQPHVELRLEWLDLGLIPKSICSRQLSL